MAPMNKPVILSGDRFTPEDIELIRQILSQPIQCDIIEVEEEEE